MKKPKYRRAKAKKKIGQLPSKKVIQQAVDWNAVYDQIAQG